MQGFWIQKLHFGDISKSSEPKKICIWNLFLFCVETSRYFARFGLLKMKWYFVRQETLWKFKTQMKLHFKK